MNDCLSHLPPCGPVIEFLHNNPNILLQLNHPDKCVKFKNLTFCVLCCKFQHNPKMTSVTPPSVWRKLPMIVWCVGGCVGVRVSHLRSHYMPGLVTNMTLKIIQSSYPWCHRLCLMCLCEWVLTSSSLFVCSCVCACVVVCIVQLCDCEKQPLTYFTEGLYKRNIKWDFSYRECCF